MIHRELQALGISSLRADRAVKLEVGITLVSEMSQYLGTAFEFAKFPISNLGEESFSILPSGLLRAERFKLNAFVVGLLTGIDLDSEQAFESPPNGGILSRRYNGGY